MARCLNEPKCNSIMWSNSNFRKSDMRKLCWLKTQGENSSLYVSEDSISVYIKPESAKEDHSHALTTSSLKPNMPIFDQKLGANKPLNITLGYKDMKIDFKRYTNPTDYNIQLRFTLKMEIYYAYTAEEYWHMNLPTEEILYDELQFLIEARVINEKRKTHLTLQKYELDHTHGTRHSPYRNSLGLSKNEYLEFLQQMGSQLKEDKTYLNNYLKNGIDYPFNVPEFETQLYFNHGAIYHIFTQRDYTEEEVN